jgi:hypothetical protein
LEEQSIASRYLTQITRDSINQYDGTIQQKVSEEIGLDGFMFVGSVQDNSRPGCVHMTGIPEPVNICVGSGKNRKCTLTANRFQDIALESGGFRKSDIGLIIQRNKNDKGWDPDTTEENYYSKRNGFNCRHFVVPYRINEDEATVKESLNLN